MNAVVYADLKAKSETLHSKADDFYQQWVKSCVFSTGNSAELWNSFEKTRAKAYKLADRAFAMKYP